jgi:hypothetical protein
MEEKDMGIGAFRFESELQRGGAEAGFEGVEEVPCDDFPGAKVEGGAEVTPARSSVDVSDIGHPNLIGPGRRWCCLQEIGSDGASVATIGGFGSVAALLAGFEAASGHEPGDAAATVAAALGTEFALDASCAVGLATGVKLGLDLVSKSLILLVTGAFWLGKMVVVATPADLQGFAAFGDGVSNWIGRLRLSNGVMDDGNHLVEGCGCWLKMAKAFFKMSRCRVM